MDSRLRGNDIEEAGKTMEGRYKYIGEAGMRLGGVGKIEGRYKDIRGSGNDLSGMEITFWDVRT